MKSKITLLTIFFAFTLLFPAQAFAASSDWDAMVWDQDVWFIDSDGDGVANASDLCPGFDDTIDLNSNGIPDDCDSQVNYQGSVADYHSSTLTGASINDQLIIFGSTENDKIAAAAFTNTFEGRGGNDKLIGFTGNDTYYFAAGDGKDTLIDWGHGFSNNDRILFAPGIVPADVTFRVSGLSQLHLIISYGSGDEIEVQNWFYNPNFLIEEIHFDGGVIWDTVTIVDSMVIGTPGDDVLNGWVADLTFAGDDGNDIINGGPLNDTIDGGLGNDIITDENGDDIVTGGEGDDVITMRGWSDPVDGVGDTVDGGLGNDTIVISHMTNTIVNGGDGMDHISVSWNFTEIDAVRAENHENTLIGGLGDDVLMGYAGSDTYPLNDGDGTDVINDWDNGRNSVDKVVFGGTIPVPVDADVTLVNGSLVIDYGTGDQLIIENWEDPNYRIESFEYNGGDTVLTDTDMDNLLP